MFYEVRQITHQTSEMLSCFVLCYCLYPEIFNGTSSSSNSFQRSTWCI